jgi:pimeloyl-ACP methyl ester carboxylesterase
MVQSTIRLKHNSKSEGLKTFSLKRVGMAVLRIILLVVIGLVLLILFRQHDMIYHPRPYGGSYSTRLPKSAVELKYSTTEGQQVSFFIPPKNSLQNKPVRLWALFCGNASLALDWDDFVNRCPDERNAFLPIEYPGYGQCQGSASPASIEESAEKAFNVLAETLKMDRGSLDQDINAIGLSIGCATALNFCMHHPVHTIILVAPFTSLKAMARRVVGFPLCNLLTHDFDNRARLADLDSRKPPPKITIFHGSDDDTIPPAMGRELSGMFPKMIRFEEVEGANHNSILFDAGQRIYDVMRQ